MKIKIFSSIYNLGDNFKLPVIVNGEFKNSGKKLVSVLGSELILNGARYVDKNFKYSFLVGTHCEVLSEN